MKKRHAHFQQFLSHDFEADDEQVVDALLDEVLPLIGMVAMQFNALEVGLNSAICSGFSDRSDETGLVVIHGMPYTQKVDLFNRMCESLHAGVARPVPPQFAGLTECMKEAGRLRNLVIHADWHSTDAEGYTFTRLRITSGSMQQEYVQLTAPALEQVIDHIIAARGQLEAYVEERNILQYT